MFMYISSGGRTPKHQETQEKWRLATRKNLAYERSRLSRVCFLNFLIFHLRFGRILIPSEALAFSYNQL